MTVVVSKSAIVLWNVLQKTAGPQPQRNLGFIEDLDAAIKDKVSEIYVSDEASGRNARLVSAYFRNPPGELRTAPLPRIIIDLLSFGPARSREQRSGDLLIPYTPRGYTPRTNGRPYTTREAPIPYDFVYQISAVSRFYHHDRAIQTAMLDNTRFPPRGAYLVVNDTVHQMFVDEASPRMDNRIESEPGGSPKRVFRSIWTLRVSQELFQQDLLGAGLASEIDISYAEFAAGALVRPSA